MKKFFVLTILFLIIIVIGIFFWWQSATSPVDPSNTSQKSFTISQGESIRTIGESLEKEGLIRNASAFYLLVKWHKFDNKIQSGSFALSPSVSLSAITEKLMHGSLDYWLIVPEGKRAAEIAEILKTKAPNYDKAWENDLEENEGYLFPDSYRIPANDSIDTIISLMRKNFDTKFATIGIVSKPKKEIVTIASLVEREAKFSEDRPLVASVIYNRLNINMGLQIDASLQYALGYSVQEHTWWRQNLTVDDLNLDSPYNTKLNTGLPPTPICNPGLSSLEAAAHPAATDYLYYVSDSQGHLHFAKTLDQHTSNIQKYNVQ